MARTPIAAHDFKLPITTEGHLKKFVEIAWGVHIPDKQVCPNHSTPWHAFADAYFARSPVTVWKASRGFGGKSFLLALLGLTEAVTHKADVNVLGGSGEQSARVHEHMQLFWAHGNAPRSMLASDPSRRETKLVWGNTIKALMASQASVRGPHPQRLRLDEIDEMDVKILDAAMGQPMGRDGIAAQTVMSSTHQYADGTMTEILRRAAEKAWPVHEWCYRETQEPHGWLLRSEIARKRTEVTAAMWSTEYELQEPSPEARAIQPDAVKAMFRRSLGVYEGRNGEYIEIEPPIAGMSYATGADWAKKQDWTVIPTLITSTAPMCVVAFERQGRKPWPLMVGRLEERLARFGGRAAHDATGLGDVVDDLLTKHVEPVMMVGRARSDLISEYIKAIEHGEIFSPYIRFMESEHRLASVDDVYRAGTAFHLPDSIAAMALAYRAASKGGAWGF
jgi:hypothetical protein